MKSFLFSLLALGILIAVIIGNGFYVRDVASELSTKLEQLPECAQAKESAQALWRIWQKQEKHLELSVSTTDINDIGNHFTQLCVAARQNDKEAFEQARALCLLGLSRIHDFERFSFLHIL
jgi:hypothetical protein